MKRKGVDVVSYNLGAFSILNKVFAETGFLSILRYANFGQFLLTWSVVFIQCCHDLVREDITRVVHCLPTLGRCLTPCDPVDFTTSISSQQHANTNNSAVS